jgi:hypothetical protein
LTAGQNREKGVKASGHSLVFAGESLSLIVARHLGRGKDPTCESAAKFLEKAASKAFQNKSLFIL